MGMYDTLRCQFPLPLPQFQDRDWQTKDLRRWLCDYVITTDGRLMLMSGEHGEEINPPQRVPFHGMVWFHGFADDNAPPTDRGWVEFRAKFTDNKCVGIEVAEYREPGQ